MQPGRAGGTSNRVVVWPERTGEAASSVVVKPNRTSGTVVL